MAGLGRLAIETLRRDKACRACGITARAVLATHHVIPVELGGRDALSNLVILCANCHRSVHWLAAANRCTDSHAYGLGSNATIRRRILRLAGAFGIAGSET